MGIYSKVLKESSFSFPTREITLEEALEIQYEWMEILESNNEEYDDLLTEGANIDYTKAFKDAIKDYSSESKLAKKCIKSKKYSEAKTHVTKMKKALNKCEKIVKDTPSTAGSAVFGFFAGKIMEIIRLIVPSSALKLSQKAFISSAKAGKIALFGISSVGVTVSFIYAFVKSVIELYKIIEQLIKDIKSKDTAAADTLNYYRNTIIRTLNELQKKCDDLNKIIDKKAKEDK